VSRLAARDAEFAALKQRFFDSWVEAEPEEASTMGLADPFGRLRDPSITAATKRGRAAAAVLSKLAALEAEGPLDREQHLDAWALRAHARETVLAADRGRAAVSLEEVPYAIMMLAHAAAHVNDEVSRRTVTGRVSALPAFVDAAREALRTGVREGRAFSTAVVEVVAQQLATAEADLLAIVSTAFEHAPHHAEVAVSAAAAAKEVATFVAFLREEVAPSSGARDVVALGEREYERRLSDWWGLSGIGPLQQGAEAELADARTQMTELAAQLATTIPGAPASVRSFGDATATVMALLKPTAASADGIIPLYQAAIARAQDFCRERGTFTIPDPCQCEVRPSPELWRKFSACTNWPAPLFGGDAPGACAVLLDPALHPLANVQSLSVHEAVPGHFLQSRAWQLRFGKSLAPVRLLSVPDECGVLRDAWIPQLMIEGWAVYAESEMQRAGFYRPVEQLFHFFCRAIHAARALADVGLHAQGWTRARVADFLVASTGMPLPWAERQAVRYARSGLQALSYLQGQLEIEAVRSAHKAAHGERFADARFQAELLGAGPVPPSKIEPMVLT
jgi:uncharacterized protein (DUF885 family)